MSSTRADLILHLGIGEIIISPKPSTISTVLGSCVSISLYSKKYKIGGLIHYTHAYAQQKIKQGEEEDYKYGEFALPMLVQEMARVTQESPSQWEAKIMGGAFESPQVELIARENVQFAEEKLAEYKITVTGKDVGGTQGRQIIFHTHTGRMQVAKVGKPKPDVTKPDVAKPDATPKQVSSQQKKKVLIVDDSKVIRDLLTRILKEDPDLEIIGTAADAFEAQEWVQKVKPDVITLDIHMPKMTGVEWLEKLLPQHKIPVVMISSLEYKDGNEVFRALELGAVDYIQKPMLKDLPVVAPLIREKVKIAASAKVNTRRSVTYPRLTLSQVGYSQSGTDFNKIMAIGASTGGTEALKVVLTMLPEKIPPLLIVQHIPPVFSKAFSDRMNSLCPFEVKEAEDGDEVMPSRVLIAPGGKQMKLQKTGSHYCVRVNDDAPMNRHKPSVDYLFYSIVPEFGKNCTAAILTGMGADGAKGLLELRKAGAKTFGQDEETCVVYGMPKAAHEMGAVEKQVPIEKIAFEMIQATVKKQAA